MRLIGSNTSPYVRKVRIVLAEKKIDCRYELEDVWKADSKIRDINPLGKVPALIMDDGGALFDSRVIVEYLDSLTPLHRLIPQPARQRVEVRCWEALADGICDAAILLRLEQTTRKPEQQSTAWMQRQLDKVEAGLAAISKGVGDRQWCSGKAFSLSDVAVGCALDYLVFRFPALGWKTQFPNLADLHDRLMKRPSFTATAPE